MHFNHLQLKITNLILTLSEKVTKINKITKQKFFIFMQMVTFKLNSKNFIFEIYFFEILKGLWLEWIPWKSWPHGIRSTYGP